MFLSLLQKSRRFRAPRKPVGENAVGQINFSGSIFAPGQPGNADIPNGSGCERLGGGRGGSGWSSEVVVSVSHCVW